MLEIHPVTLKHLDYVFSNMREYDREELGVQGWTKEKAIQDLSNCVYKYTLVNEDGLPVAIGGAMLRYGSFILFGVGTDEATKRGREITKFVKAFLELLSYDEWNANIRVQVMKSHKKSLRWLKWLGFKKIKDTKFPSGEVLRLMELQ